MEPVTTTAAIGIAGKFLWDRFAAQGDNAVGNFLKCTERAGKKAASKGELPANHHLRNASIGALRDAVSMLAVSLQQQRGAKAKAGDPVDIWNIGLARLANEVPADFKSGALVDFHDSDFGFTEPELTELFGSGGIFIGKMGERLHERFAVWATEELSETGFTSDPDYLNSIISDGWVPQGKKTKKVAAEECDTAGKVTLFAAYAWFFRFRLKNVDEVFRIFTADVLADIQKHIKSPKADLADFETFLRDEIGESTATILNYLEGFFELNQEAHETTQGMVGELKQSVDKLVPANVILHGAAASIRLPVSDFAGRTADIDALESLAQSGAIVSGVRGTGGIGKTELAREIARRWNDKFAENYEIDCLGAGDNPFTPVQIIERLLRIWHPTAQLPEDVNTLASALHGELGKRNGGVLLLLDNVSDAAQIAPIFPLPAGCAALVTSRRRFTMAGMKTHDLEAMDEAAAIALLQAIASGKLENEETIARAIAIACGRLPKALRLAGEALDSKPISPATWLTRFQANRLAHLDEVESALEISLSLLDSDDDRRAFVRLGIFTASFPRDAAHAVLAEVDAENADTRLENLHAISLIDYRPETDRFVLHDLAREYALKTGGEAETVAASGTMAQWAEASIRTANEQYLKGSEHILPALAWFDQERRHIESAWLWAHTANWKENNIALTVTAFLPKAGTYLLNLRQHPQERIEWLEWQVKAFQKLENKLGEVSALGNLGNAWADLGEKRKAIGFYEKILVIHREISDLRGEGQDLGNLGNAWYFLGELDMAISYHEQALEITRRINDRFSESNSLCGLGIAWVAQGHPCKAIKFHEQALEISREIGDRQGEGIAFGNLGRASSKIGELRKASEYHAQALDIFREIGDLRGEGNALANQGVAFSELNQVTKAIKFLDQALEVFRKIGDRRGEGNALWNSALAYDNLGEREEAIRRAEATLEIHEATEDPFTQKVRAKLEEWRGE